jgi:hypothetical protein
LTVDKFNNMAWFHQHLLTIRPLKVNWMLLEYNLNQIRDLTSRCFGLMISCFGFEEQGSQFDGVNPIDRVLISGTLYFNL